jgi:predicted HTH domain antitoxin
MLARDEGNAPMQLTLDIPDDVAAALRATHGDDLGRAALERLAIEAFQAGRLTAYQVQTLLGFSDRFETEAWLGQRGACRNYSLEDLEADRDILGRLLSG